MIAPASKPVQQRILRRRCGCRRCQGSARDPIFVHFEPDRPLRRAVLSLPSTTCICCLACLPSLLCKHTRPSSEEHIDQLFTPTRLETASPKNGENTSSGGAAGLCSCHSTRGNAKYLRSRRQLVMNSPRLLYNALIACL